MKIFQKLKDRILPKKEEGKPITPELVIEIYKNKEKVQTLSSSDENQIKNYSDLMRYMSYYEFELIYDLERGLIEVYLLPKKLDVLDLS